MQKYPGFADRVHEGLVDVFGDKGRYENSSRCVHRLSDSLLSNIVTHHAEDGSGVGSAIIAG